MGLAFFVRESLRSIQRNAIPSFAAMASVLVTLLVLGVFIPVVQATTGAANEVRSKVMLDAPSPFTPLSRRGRARPVPWSDARCAAPLPATG